MASRMTRQLVSGDAQVDGPLDALLPGAAPSSGRRVRSIAITVEAVSFNQYSRLESSPSLMWMTSYSTTSGVVAGRPGRW